jgi:hypothetical protein
MFNEPSRVPLSDLYYFWSCAKRIEDTALQGVSVKCFLTTYSEYVRNESIARFGTEKIFTIEGDIGHIHMIDKEQVPSFPESNKLMSLEETLQKTSCQCFRRLLS